MDETEFPSNSRKQKTAKDEKKDEPKVEKVVVGNVTRRKKPLGKRMAETFVGGDTKGVWSYILHDVMIPAAKDMLADAGSQGLERMLFGEARSAGRRRGRGSAPYGHVNYQRMGSHPAGRAGRSDERTYSRRARASHDFDEILLDTRVEAEEVIDRLFDLVSRYEQATVEDLYDMVGIDPNYTDKKWGWVDLRGAGVTRTRAGYLLDLPRPEPLD